MGDLKNIINEFDVILLSETWLTEKHTFNIPKYHIIRKDRKSDHASEGVAVKIKKHILFRELNTFYHKNPSLEYLAFTIPITVNNKTERLLTTSTLRHPSQEI